jgi:SAM-dependent methyltransferase
VTPTSQPRDQGANVPPAVIGVETPNPARIYDYYLGGKDHFAADREAAEKVMAAYPVMPRTARENRAFLGRAVRFLVGRGVRQFIDIGCGLPTAENTHQIAHRAAPGSKIIYVDHDPVVLVHVRALLDGAETSTRTTVVGGDLREPKAILSHPDVRAAIDLSRPVGLLLVAVLHFVRDEEDPAGIVTTLTAAVPPGSYVVLSHATGDSHPEVAAEAASAYDTASAPLVLRTHAEVTALLDGLVVVGPGVVRIPEWRPEHAPPPDPEDRSAHTLTDPTDVWGYAAVARKPGLARRTPTRAGGG